MRTTWRDRACALGAVLLLGSGLAACQPDAPRLFPHALVTPSPRPLPTVDLVGMDGRAFATSALAGRWVWLYFGYARCPDVCPTAMIARAAEYKRLTTPARVAVVFVSVDPANDTPAKLTQFATFYEPAFLAVTGKKAMIDTLAHAVSAGYVIDSPAPGRKPTETRISHSNLVFVVDPEGRYVASYAPGAPAGDLAADTQAAVQANKEHAP